jgi:hypothetical protein
LFDVRQEVRLGACKNRTDGVSCDFLLNGDGTVDFEEFLGVDLLCIVLGSRVDVDGINIRCGFTGTEKISSFG